MPIQCMYNSRRNNYKGFREKRRAHSFSSKFRGGFSHSGKKLDPRLFIKKAEYVDDQAVLERNLPTQYFSDYQIVDKLKRNIQDHGYTIPTEIQAKTIPQILAGHDIIGIANTGTGKTAAFL